jgi:hypothetical protein
VESHELSDRSGLGEPPLSGGDLELLASALQDAIDAHEQGVIVGPRLDEVALARAWARACDRDEVRELRMVADGAA